MNIRFEPGPYERTISGQRIKLPEEIIEAMQGSREVYILAREGIAKCYPESVCISIIEIVRLVDRPRTGERIFDIAARIGDRQFRDMYRNISAAHPSSIDEFNRLYFPKHLVGQDKVIIEGHENYFEIRGENILSTSQR